MLSRLQDMVMQMLGIMDTPMRMAIAIVASRTMVVMAVVMVVTAWATKSISRRTMVAVDVMAMMEVTSEIIF
jgi:hypothetical protein